MRYDVCQALSLWHLCRLVAMSSLFEQLGSIKWDDLEGYKTKSSSLFEYADSKVMVIMMGREINKRLKVLEARAG